MASFLDPAADPIALFHEGPTLSHEALHITPSSGPPTGPVDFREERVEEMYVRLNRLTLQAEEILAQQPRATQINLTVEIRGLFKEYKLIGSMIRLERGIEKFFNAGDRNGTLIFKSAEKQSSQKLKDSATSGNGEPAHYGKAFMHNYTADDDKYEHPEPAEGGVTPAGPQGLHPLRIIDPDSTSYVTTLPWDPVGTLVSWPAGLQWPQGLLGKVNQILSVVDHECRVRLFHHVCKYGPSPVLRAGIESQVHTHYSSIFENRAHNYLGLTPETRVFLRSIFERKSKVNVAESRLLARVCRVAYETVDLLWEDLRISRKAHMAMKVFITAREIEKGRRYIRREQNGILQQQREKFFRQKDMVQRMEAEQQKEAKSRLRHTRTFFENRDNAGPMTGGISRGERLCVDSDLQRPRY